MEILPALGVMSTRFGTPQKQPIRRYKFALNFRSDEISVPNGFLCYLIKRNPGDDWNSPEIRFGGIMMKLPRRQFLHLGAAAAVLPAISRIAHAQSYPSQQVRLIIGYPPGSGGASIER